VDKYNDEVINNFKQNNKSFIDIVKRSFSSIEKLYGVNIPLAEIYFIYEILDTKMPNTMIDA
jgi:sigma-54 dependent transcriptional regulator of gfr operon